MYLGIETSSAVSSVAVMDEQRFIGELTVQAGLTHSEQLVPHIDLLLKQSGVAKTALKGITVSIGPGSFTGLRIGMGTAKALAYALNIPLMGVMTMDGLAHNFWQFSGVLAVMVDAQKKNVYEGRYRWAAGQLVCEQAPTARTVSKEAISRWRRNGTSLTQVIIVAPRSEERRVGKECRL